MICPYCKSNVPEGKTICPECGKSVPANGGYVWDRALEDSDGHKKGKQAKLQKVLIAAGCVFCAAILIIIAVFVVGPKISGHVKHEETTAQTESDIERDTGHCVMEPQTEAPETTTEEETETEPETEPPELRPLYVEPVSGDIMDFNEANDDVFYADAVQTESYDCYLPYEEEERFRFYAFNTGYFRLEVDLYDEDQSINLVITDETEDEILWSGTLFSGEGISEVIAEDHEYLAVFGADDFYGDFRLRVYYPKEVREVSDYSLVYDRMDFYDQNNTYLFKPDVSGEYRFSIPETDEGMQLIFSVMDEDGNKYGAFVGGQGDETVVELNADSRYYLILWQDVGSGNYTLQIERPQLAKDISGCIEVKHNVSRPGQVNSYYYTPEVSGVYTFRVEDPEDDVRVSLRLLEQGEEIRYKDDVAGGDGFTVTLDAGERCLLQVGQYAGYGNYTLCIDPQKPDADVSRYDLVEDCIQFAKQTNNYIYTAGADGTFSFGVESMPAGMRVFVAVYNSSNDQLAHGVSLGDGAYIKVPLQKDKTYRIEVRQESDIGNYILKIEKPAEKRQAEGEH